MSRFNKAGMQGFLHKEVNEMASSAKDLGSTMKETFRPPANGAPLHSAGLMDPIRFKRFLITLLKILIIVELGNAFTKGASGGGWGQFGTDLVVAGILYLMWDNIKTIIREKKEESARRMKEPGHHIRLWDALAFSLLWSDEIYKDIPLDRRRLVVISFTLIGLSLLVAFLSLGGGLMPLVISGSLVLAAVNLLAWVVSTERGEKETLQTELKLAHEVQTSLMPKSCPPVEGFDIAGRSLAAREVGGDHFDYCFLNSDKDTLGISVFDVSGKGLHAAMSAVFTSGAFVSEAKRSGSPSGILTRLNVAVYGHSQRGHFVAFLLAVLDVQQKQVTFSNAGQMKPLLRSNGTAKWLDSVGIKFPLGMVEDSAYQERTLDVHGGDVLILLTDGLTEAMNASREQYGTERLAEFVNHLSVGNLSAQQIAEAINNDIRAFVGSAAQHDDMTMVVVKVL
jgi:serine phosphatase RsbU (regulator of sigma subunit)